MSARKRWSVLLLGSILAIPGWAEDTVAANLDPVVIEVVEMLAAGVDEDVIVQWLESTGRRPLDIDSRGVIALSEAGASDSLMSTLLQGLVREPIEARFRLSAKQIWIDEDEPDNPRQPPWDIYLYLDGDFVARTRPTLQGEPVEVRQVILAGHRELRVVLQRMEKRRSGWHFESLSIPTLMEFEPRSGDPIEVEVEIERIWGLWRDRRNGGPLSYIVRQGESVLAEDGGTGGDPDRWRPVCEDVEANFPDSETVPGRYRNPMSRCVRWADLWTGTLQAASRVVRVGEP